MDFGRDPGSGRTAIVTGANSGIGFETARVLAHKGARVVLACRNAGKAAWAAEAIRTQKPRGTVEVARLDLSDLDLVAPFASAFLAGHDRLDLLVNNAGVMTPPLTAPSRDEAARRQPADPACGHRPGRSRR